ncbi:MAG: hypothetical protein ACFFC7_30115 [Candidatus Hermodarchaeota archaeon]
MGKKERLKVLTEWAQKTEIEILGQPIKDIIFELWGVNLDLFSDDLEEIIYVILLNQAYHGQVGSTSAMLESHTKYTKTTLNFRLKSLHLKRLVAFQPMGNAFLYFVPLPQLMLDHLKGLLSNTIQAKTSSKIPLFLQDVMRVSLFSQAKQFFLENPLNVPMCKIIGLPETA